MKSSMSLNFMNVDTKFLCFRQSFTKFRHDANIKKWKTFGTYVDVTESTRI